MTKRREQDKTRMTNRNYVVKGKGFATSSSLKDIIRMILLDANGVSTQHRTNLEDLRLGEMARCFTPNGEYFVLTRIK